MAYVDKTLTCKDCGEEFVFSAREQEFYAEKGFENEPARCPDCRRAKKQSRNNNRRGDSRGPQRNNRRELFTTTCSACGVETQVPFKPSGDRPVYCRDCFQNQR